MGQSCGHLDVQHVRSLVPQQAASLWAWAQPAASTGDTAAQPQAHPQATKEWALPAARPHPLPGALPWAGSSASSGWSEAGQFLGTGPKWIFQALNRTHLWQTRPSGSREADRSRGLPRSWQGLTVGQQLLVEEADIPGPQRGPSQARGESVAFPEPQSCLVAASPGGHCSHWHCHCLAWKVTIDWGFLSGNESRLLSPGPSVWSPQTRSLTTGLACRQLVPARVGWGNCHLAGRCPHLPASPPQPQGRGSSVVTLPQA